MIIKVCGIKDADNIKALSNMDINMIGLNFYTPSKRYLPEDTLIDEYNQLPPDIKKVGVFVNADIAYIKKQIDTYSLDFVQLHGDETATYGQSLSKLIDVIKVFSISNIGDLPRDDDHDYAMYYLFDTKTPDYGGSGHQFSWKILDSYQGDIPFILAGGISAVDYDTINTITHPKFAGIDINSRFEISAGIKDTNMIQDFLERLD